MTGLEPVRAKSSTDFKSVVSTYSTTRHAFLSLYWFNSTVPFSNVCGIPRFVNWSVANRSDLFLFQKDAEL